MGNVGFQVTLIDLIVVFQFESCLHMSLQDLFYCVFKVIFSRTSGPVLSHLALIGNEILNFESLFWFRKKDPTCETLAPPRWWVWAEFDCF